MCAPSKNAPEVSVTMHNSNVDDLGAFDLDSIDDCVWDDLLTDVQDLDPGPTGSPNNNGPQSLPQTSAKPQSNTGNVAGHQTPGLSEQNRHTHNGLHAAAIRSRFDIQDSQSSQRRQQQFILPHPELSHFAHNGRQSSEDRRLLKPDSKGRKPGQQTIDSMFATKNGTLGQMLPLKRSMETSNGPIRAASPAHPPSKMAKTEAASADEVIILDDDDVFDDFDFAEETFRNPPAPAPIPHTLSSNSHTVYSSPHGQKQLPFQIRELAVRSKGDNTLVESTHALDQEALESFVYPLLGGQPARAYQQGAIQRCIFQNTLVALPTGMGKTLIAAVVMANYALWFPNSMSIFLAPTKPLVAQQTQACRGLICALFNRACSLNSSRPRQEFGSSWVAEMNGNIHPTKRRTLWSESRFVFSTPQILQNDLKSGVLDGDNSRRIVLLVIDEAHRATGKYAYGESVGILHSLYHGPNACEYNPMQPCKAAPFRVMALTATPGSNIKAVQDIVHRLHVSHIFLRTEESLDVVPYIHGRRIEEVLVDLPPWLMAARDCLAMVMQRSINLLCGVCRAMPHPGDLKRLSGFQVRMERDRFCAHSGNSRGMDIGRISSEFTIVISLAHIMQLLSEHGLRPAWVALRSWQQEVDLARKKLGSTTRAKADCVNSKEWTTMLQEFGALVDALDRKPAIEAGASSSRTIPQQSNARTDVVSSFFNFSNTKSLTANLPAGSNAAKGIAALAPPGFLGHPKLERLVHTVKLHFDQHGGDDSSTRVIVFSQYRGSVSEIVSVLNSLQPRVRSEAFIGQGNGTSNRPRKPQSSDSGSESNSAAGGAQWRGRGSRGYGRGRGRGRGYGRGAGNGRSNAEPSSTEDDLPEGLDNTDPSMRGQSQKEQLAVLGRFRQGETNIIVATCVGEEGLDIGEVDLIINYDAPSSPIRLLQRIGRTGRARRGKVIVFLAKDTREENSYQKAQREYKSLQGKIAAGKGLQLRQDLSPPMIPPSLALGMPMKTELHLSKEEITREGDAADTAKRPKGKQKSAVHAGVGDDDADEFAMLSYKYQLPRATADSEIVGTGLANHKVVQLLEKGIAWQSSASPRCQIEHSRRSVVYQRIMLGLENARFGRELADGLESSSSPRGFRMPDMKDLNGAAALPALSVVDAPSAQPRPQRTSNKRISKKKPRRAASLDSPKPPSDSSDDSLDGLDTILARPPPRLNNDAVSERPGLSGSMGDDKTSHHRRRSSQQNIFESIDKLIKSGKAKHAFDWSLTLDSELLVLAKDRGIDLELTVHSEPSEKQLLSEEPPTTGSIFGDIGRPGICNKLYDEDQVRLLIDGPPVPDSLDNRTSREHVDNGDLLSSCNSDVTHNSRAAIQAPSVEMGDVDADLELMALENQDAFDLSLLGDLQVDTPPTPPISASPIHCAPADHSAAEVMLVDSPAGDNGAVDDELLAFDINSSDIFILSDDDAGMDGRTKLGEALAPTLDTDMSDNRSTSGAAGLLDLELSSGLRKSSFEKLQPSIPSSSPVRQKGVRRGNRGLISNGALDVSADLPSSPLRSVASPLEELVRKRGGKLVRGRRIEKRSATSTFHKESMSSSPPFLLLMPQQQAAKKTKKKKSKRSGKLRPQPRQARNQFMDTEADIGYSDDNDSGPDIAGHQGAGRVASDDERDDDDLDQDLSSFIVDDEDDVEYDTPTTADRAIGDADTASRADAASQHIGDVYRRSLVSPTTPMTEIMRRLAEREKQRRWVSDSPTRNAGQAGTYRSLALVGDNSGSAASDATDSEISDADTSSDFEKVENLFTQAA
ncbi:3'-5' DNA helicase [Coemansia sp. RSA 988]|nr:3'-5' DNA helicase [Coemansia sp. RSA 988]